MKLEVRQVTLNEVTISAEDVKEALIAVYDTDEELEVAEIMLKHKKNGDVVLQFLTEDVLSKKHY